MAFESFNDVGVRLWNDCAPAVSAIKDSVKGIPILNKYIPSSSPAKAKVKYETIKQKKRVDKRVSLNVRPLVSNPSAFVDRVEYVLGSKQKSIGKSTLYGFLYGCLNKSVGLIFPYTPTISNSYSVNYERTEITHSNVAISHYKNTPPPTFDIDAKFTADSRENAKHMLSAIWFLRAVTKCEFGERTDENYRGLPPPILYLNGWNNMYDNIPVVVKSFSFSYPEDLDYVNLELNLDSSSTEFQQSLYSDALTGDFFNNAKNATKSAGSALKFINGQLINTENIQNNVSTTGKNVNDDFYLSFWLPTEVSIRVSLEAQPNLLKTKKLFQLDDYKMGKMFLGKYKSGDSVYAVTESGEKIEACQFYDTDMYGYIENQNMSFDKQALASTLKDGYVYTSGKPIKVNWTDSKGAMDAQLNGAEILFAQKKETSDGFKMSGEYKFDNSGWTW